VHTQFRRHRLDAHFCCSGLDDDDPGLGLFYGGMVRKNVGDTVMTSFAVTCPSRSFRASHLQHGVSRRRAFCRGLIVCFKDILSDIGKGGIGNPNPLPRPSPASTSASR
jgi:Amt family ammonium transporter